MSTNVVIEQRVILGTNAPPGFVRVWTKNQLDAWLADHIADMSAWSVFVSNRLSAENIAAKAALDANLTKLLALYAQIPTARSNFTTGRSLLVTIDASFASGTNNTAQLVSRMRQMVNVQSETIRYLDGIVEILQRLGPVLRDMYKPEQDDVQ